MKASNSSKQITMPYDEYLSLKYKTEKRFKELFGMEYEEILKMASNYKEVIYLKDRDFREILNLRQRINEYNSLPWYKRLFRNIQTE